MNSETFGFFAGLGVLLFCFYVGDGLNYYLHNIIPPMEIKHAKNN